MRIGALWLKKAKKKDGAEYTYMSGQVEVPFLGKLNFAVFKNTKKNGGNSPDYFVEWNPPREKRTTGPAGEESPF